MDEYVLSNTCRAYAGRLAISSLYPNRITTQAAALRAVSVIRKRWRWLVGRLAELGWPPAKTVLHQKYLAHCPPFGVVRPKALPLLPPTRFCLRALHCPFCYARRYAANAFDRLAPILEAKERWRLLTTEWEKWIDAEDYPRVVDLFKAAGAVVNGPDRRLEVDVARPLGAVVFHRVRIATRHHLVKAKDVVSGLTVVRTAVMVLPPGDYLDMVGGVRFRLTPDPTRGTLAAAVGRAFRYPQEWYDHPAEAVALGGYVAKARPFSAFGACRQSRAAAEDAAESEDTDLTPVGSEGDE